MANIAVGHFIPMSVRAESNSLMAAVNLRRAADVELTGLVSFGDRRWVRNAYSGRTSDVGVFASIN